MCNFRQNLIAKNRQCILEIARLTTGVKSIYFCLHSCFNLLYISTPHLSPKLQLQNSLRSIIFYLIEYLFLAQVALSAPPEVAFAMTIVITNFRSLFFSFLLRLLHFGETPEAENLFPPIFWRN